MNRRPRADVMRVAALFVAGTCVAAVPALAQSGAEIRACVQRSSLQVRIIGPTDVCRAVESLVTWNQKGPAGPVGPAGPKGDKGEPGTIPDLFNFARIDRPNMFGPRQTFNGGFQSNAVAGFDAGLVSSGLATFNGGIQSNGSIMAPVPFAYGIAIHGMVGMAEPGDTRQATAVVGDSPSANGIGVSGHGGVFGVIGAATGAPACNPDGSCTRIPAGVQGLAFTTHGMSFGVQGLAYSPEGFGVHASNMAAGGKALQAFTMADNGIAVHAQAMGAGSIPLLVSGEPGNVGIRVDMGGTTNAPGTVAARFRNYSGDHIIEGEGRAGRFWVTGEGVGYFTGGTQVGGADFAESVEVAGAKDDYEPGDLMAIDTSGTRRLVRTSTAYSTLVAGIYSTTPGVLAGSHDQTHATFAREIPLAMIGIVPCKVTAENGAIAAGDLLVSASRPGFAMKGTDGARMPGAVVGKALEPLRGSTGVILVLVTLQ